MRIILKIIFLASAVIWDANAVPAEIGTPIQVVTSFSILENLVTELGGEHVQVRSLVGRNSDSHVYQPKPSDLIAIAEADLVVTNGLGFEGWIARIMNNNNYTNARLVASEGVDALMLGDEIDPHAWQSFKNIRVYIDNISKMLITLKPEHEDEFLQLHDIYEQKITELENDLMQQMNSVAPQKRMVVTSHNTFHYLGKEYGIQFLAPVGLSTDTDPTASDVSTIIQYIRRRGIKALFVENINDPRLLQQISAESGVVIGGSLYSDALSDTDGPAATYLAMMRHNIEMLVQAFN